MTNLPWQDLARRLEGDFSLEERVLKEHSEDASIFIRRPLAVVFPKSISDIRAALSFCTTHGIPLNFRGAGTSRGGQPLCAGLVLNFRRHMNKILGFNESTGELEVEPGVYYSEVQKFLATKGRSFPPDPSYHQCTVGGMVANNAAGIHSVKYGGTVEHVAGLEYLTTDGAVHNTDKLDAIEEQVAQLIQPNAALIKSDFPRVEKNSAGYNLNLAYRDNPEKLDLPKLLCGSEGTLAVFTKIRIRSVPLPKAKALAISFFATIDKALMSALDLSAHKVAACELVDKVLLDLHSEHLRASGPKHAKRITENPYLDFFYENNCEAILIHEYDGDTLSQCQAARASAVSVVAPYTIKTMLLENADQERLAWDLRRHTSPILNKLEDGKVAIKPLWAVEDVSLPKEKLLEYVRDQRAIFTRYGITCSFFGHAASANLHIDPVGLDPRLAYRDEEKAKIFDLVAEESYSLIIRLGGSISGEHGDGILRTKYLKRQYPGTYKLFADLKRVFDPIGILNPGNIVEGR